jgi:hypothetical protein
MKQVKVIIAINSIVYFTSKKSSKRFFNVFHLKKELLVEVFKRDESINQDLNVIATIYGR